MKARIAPSILSADFTNISDEIASIEQSGAHWVHLDVMDGYFVPNITFGPFVIKQLRSLTTLPFDAHLMIEHPNRYIDAFADAGCDMITVHVEADRHLHRTLSHIKQLGLRAGVSLNPSTPLSSVTAIADMIDILLIMTVNPGFGGQSFIPSMMKKVTTAVQMKMAQQAHWTVSVDGGVNRENAVELFKQGVDVAVMGSAFFSLPTIEERQRLVHDITL